MGLFVAQSGRKVRSLLCEVGLHFNRCFSCGPRRGIWCVCAATHVAALDGDGLGNMHTKQWAEGLRLRWAHAGHSSGLNPISTGYWTLTTQHGRQLSQHHALRYITIAYHTIHNSQVNLNWTVALEQALCDCGEEKLFNVQSPLCLHILALNLSYIIAAEKWAWPYLIQAKMNVGLMLTVMLPQLQHV